jgi:hypothetical protein
MPLGDILACTLGKKGLSSYMEIRQYFQAAGKMEQTVSKQDYLRQRQKLNPEAFKALNRNYLKRFYEGDEAERWQGYLVLANDGSKAEIPNSEENRRVYGQSKNQHGKGVARANLSSLYDINNRFILDIRTGKYQCSEIEEAKAHTLAVKEIVGEQKVLIVFDRNYGSLDFMDILESSGIKYLIRLQKNHYKADLALIEGEDSEIELAYTKTRLKNLKQADPQRRSELRKKKSTPVRIVKGETESGEPLTLVTNLREGTGEELRQLYRKRWAIEQKYHTLKNKIKFESVTGKASIYVEQDFWAQTLVFNMVQDMITAAEKRAVRNAEKKNYRYGIRINENIAIGLFKEQFIRLIMEEDDSIKNAMFVRLIADMEKNIVPIRKLKGAPRKQNYMNKYKCNLKPSF